MWLAGLGASLGVFGGLAHLPPNTIRGTPFATSLLGKYESSERVAVEREPLSSILRHEM